MSFEIIDADGHVTETWEQIARHLDRVSVAQLVRRKAAPTSCRPSTSSAPTTAPG